MYVIRRMISTDVTDIDTFSNFMPIHFYIFCRNRPVLINDIYLPKKAAVVYTSLDM